MRLTRYDLGTLGEPGKGLDLLEALGRKRVNHGRIPFPVFSLVDQVQILDRTLAALALLFDKHGIERGPLLGLGHFFF